jgi:dihydroxy-acid dehydratase
MELNKYSKTITQDETQPAAQAMLYGIKPEDDLKKAQVELLVWVTKVIHVICINDLAKILKGVWKEDLVGLILTRLV